MDICYESAKTWLTLDSLGTSRVNIVVICCITTQVKVRPLCGFYIKMTRHQRPQLPALTASLCVCWQAYVLTTMVLCATCLCVAHVPACAWVPVCSCYLAAFV